ncbi:hypothetical protein BB559_006511 [Furculomyces boomerangus]|uniref:Uncharacterized protein n=1 Tax=Furculomyces boomerangus TaxID=61424 RepID=A0A2T9Y2E3_9FUNG|nr:hypothetical protein BB559_006511 [Furculomyces boomerangus]
MMTSRVWCEGDLSSSLPESSEDESEYSRPPSRLQNAATDFDFEKHSVYSKFSLSDQNFGGSLKCIQEVSQQTSQKVEYDILESKFLIGKQRKDIQSNFLNNEKSSSNKEISNTPTEHPSEPYSDSVLSLAVIDNIVFSGSQSGAIYAWDRETYQLLKKMDGHSGGVMCLVLGKNDRLLFSSSVDGTVRVWDTNTLECLHKIIAGRNSGAIFSIAYHEKFETLILGCQNTTIQWFSLKNRDKISVRERMAELVLRKSTFFEGSGNPDIVVNSPAHFLSSQPKESSDFFFIDKQNTKNSNSINEQMKDIYVIFENSIIPHAHYGYVNSLLLEFIPNFDSKLLFSTSSDNTIKLWKVNENGVEFYDVIRLNGTDMSILSLAIHDGLLYTGMQGGDVLIWDLETKQPIRTLSGHSDDVLSIVSIQNFIYTSSHDGYICIWGDDFDPVSKILAHESSPVLSMAVASSSNVLVSGCGNSVIKFWLQHSEKYLVNYQPSNGISDSKSYYTSSNPTVFSKLGEKFGTQNEKINTHYMISCLDKWVSFKSISGPKEFQQECRNAARFLRDLAYSLGASEPQLLAGAPGRNPLVYFRFDANKNASDSDNAFNNNTRTILVYGHYDVVPVGDLSGWMSDPFTMKGKNGYLYGRGVTDNKGPILATLFAVYELYIANNLSTTVVFLIEGEEENSCQGLRQAVESNKRLFGIPKLIILSLSYWLGEKIPCLTYGMRGNIKIKLEVDSMRTNDVHSGVWGGASIEPLICLSNIISQLSYPNGDILIPELNSSVDPISEEDNQMMRELIKTVFEKEFDSKSTPNTNFNHQEVMKKLNDDISKDLINNSLSQTGLFSGDSNQPNRFKLPAEKDKVCDNSLLAKENAIYNQLMSRWRFPTLTVHKIKLISSTSNDDFGLIPPAAMATMSIRTVPNQSNETVIELLGIHIKSIVEKMVEDMKLNSEFMLSVEHKKQNKDDTLFYQFDIMAKYSDKISNTFFSVKLEAKDIARWWLADTSHPYYLLASDIISKEWNNSNALQPSQDKLTGTQLKIQNNKETCIDDSRNSKDSFFIKNSGNKKAVSSPSKLVSGVKDYASSNYSSKNNSLVSSPILDHSDMSSNLESLPTSKSNDFDKSDEYVNVSEFINSNKQRSNSDVLYIREGGSISAVPWLEKYFGGDCIAINFPMGQSSDNAHLPNERLRLVNLTKGRKILRDIIFKIGTQENDLKH